MAENLSADDATVSAEGNVVVHYGESVIQSTSALYDKGKHLLTLMGDRIEVLGYKGSKIHSKELKINTQSKKVTFKNVFLADESDIWVFSESAIKEDTNVTFGPAMMSSCDIKSRDWTFYSESSHYDSKEHYMTMRDVNVKFWDIPVLYTPYLAFSTHKERSSGLLFPSFGYTESEGAVYEQPIYWAASQSWDVELRPQIRTNRGGGAYGTLRFADSPYSQGAIRMGYFKDTEDYVLENNIKNDSHYGFEMNYDSSKVLGRFATIDGNIVDGLFVNATLLNDIDYIYLQKKPMGHFGAYFYQESRANYFVHDEDYYGGVYAKYFIDTISQNNDQSMQILPTMQLHKYLKPILLDKLTYSADLTMNNYTRKEGTTFKAAEFYAPIEYTHAFLDDYLTLSLKEDLYYNELMFGNGVFVNDDYQYFNNVTRVQLFSDLTKKYSSFVHVLQPGVTYSLPGDIAESPVEYEKLDDAQKKLFAPGIEQENVAFRASQYFYETSGDLRFYERLIQYYYPDKEEYQFGNLAHEMQYNIKNWQFYNNMIYDFEFDSFKELSSAIRWKKDKAALELLHSYQRLYAYTSENEVQEYKLNNDVGLFLMYQVTKKIGVLGGLVYDIDEEFNSLWQFGLGYNKECWNISLALRQDIRPIATVTGADSILENSFSFQLNFVPFGGIGLSSDPTNRGMMR